MKPFPLGSVLSIFREIFDDALEIPPCLGLGVFYQDLLLKSSDLANSRLFIGINQFFEPCFEFATRNGGGKIEVYVEKKSRLVQGRITRKVGLERYLRMPMPNPFVFLKRLAVECAQFRVGAMPIC